MVRNVLRTSAMVDSRGFNLFFSMSGCWWRGKSRILTFSQAEPTVVRGLIGGGTLPVTSFYWNLWIKVITNAFQRKKDCKEKCQEELLSSHLYWLPVNCVKRGKTGVTKSRVVLVPTYDWLNGWWEIFGPIAEGSKAKPFKYRNTCTSVFMIHLTRNEFLSNGLIWWVRD